MTSGRPAGPLRQKEAMINIPDQNGSAGRLPLKMALETESLVAFGQQALIDRAVWPMADGATVAHRLVLKHIRAPLCGVTLQTVLVLI